MAAVAETISQAKFTDARSLFRINSDVPYVAELLLHSSLLGTDNAFGVWGSGLVCGSEIREIEYQLEKGMVDCWTAQDAADQLLLRFGLFAGGRQLWPMESLRLQNCGSELYLKAAQAYHPPFCDQLRSMSDNFLPWVEVLRDMKHRERIPLQT